MMQTRENFYFAQEATGEIFLVGKIGQQNFHGFDAVGERVADFIDLAHAAGAESAEDEVVAFTRASDVVSHLAPADPRTSGCESSGRSKAAAILRHLRRSGRVC